MGNQKSDINIEKFRKEDWEPVQKLPDLQVWQSRKDPSYRIQQYELYTQSEAQLRQEKKMFELRRRSPLLVAAYYLQLQPNEQFCSSHSKHLLYLERIPIRLLDIEHVPYPDYLHLFDACLKGFGQLARCAGYFLVDEGMIGINQQGIAKAWLNEDFSKSYSFSGQTTQENMVRSLIDTIQRNIDSQLLPSSVPSVRNFLYKSCDALTFDTAIWQMGEYIRRFNDGKIPTKLDCIDKVGGIYTIANRQQINVNENFQRRDEHNKLQNGTGFSDVSAYAHPNLEQKLIRHTSNPHFQHPSNQNVVYKKEVLHSNQSNIIPQPQFIPINRQPIQTDIGSPRHTLSTVRRSNIIPNNLAVNFAVKGHINHTLSPRNSQQIVFQSPRQIRKIEIPINQPTVLAPLPISRSPPHNSLPITINNQRIIPQNPPVVFSQPILSTQQQTSPRAIQPPFFAPPPQHFTHQIVHNSVVIPPPKQVIPPAKHVVPFSPQLSNKAPRFTVQVVPGKVYPQKSSTIFKQSNIFKQGDVVKPDNAQKNVGSLLENHKPIITTSEKEVVQEKIEKQKQLQQRKPQETQLKQQFHVANSHPTEIIKEQIQDPVLVKQIIQKKQKDQQIEKVVEDFDKLKHQCQNQTQEINQNKVNQQVERSFLAKIQNNFDAIQKKIAVSASYEGDELPSQYNAYKFEELPLIEQKASNSNEQQGLRQDRMSLWTAGSQEKSIDYEQMERKLAISFNPAYEENTHAEQYSNPNPNQNYYENYQNYEANYQNDQQEAQKYQFNGSYGSKVQINTQDKFEVQRQASSIKQTGNFGYSLNQNDLMDPEIKVHSDPIYSTATFNTYTSEVQEKPQYNNYENFYNRNQQSSNYETNNGLNAYKGIQKKYSSQLAYTSTQYQNQYISSNYEYQKYTPIDQHSENYSHIQYSDGKSSPEFLKRLNEMTTLEAEEPRAHEYTTHQSNQSSNYYNDYLKNLTNQNPYSYTNNEFNYGSYSNIQNYPQNNEFGYSGDYFKSYSSKLGIDQE